MSSANERILSWVTELPQDKADNGTFREVELARTGSYNASTGQIMITQADLAGAVAVSKRLPNPRIKLGHYDPINDAQPYLGEVTNLKLKTSTLIGDIINMPEWLYEIAAEHFPQRSIEATMGFSSGDVKSRMAITAVALLGSTLPAIDSLEDLQKIAKKG